MNDIATKQSSRPALTAFGPVFGHADESLTWLDARWPELVEGLEALGPVRVVTRNDVATHVKVGPFDEISFNGPMGLVLDEPIDLRLFTHHWEWAYATDDGLSVFDECGRPMMRVDVTDETNADAFRSLVADFKVAAPDPEAAELPEPPDVDEIALTSDVVDAFQTDWREMTDTHEFFGVLREHGLDRAVAMRVGPPELVTRVSPEVCAALFERSEAGELPIMVFVHSPGCVQIHTGQVRVDDQRDGLMCVSGDAFEMTVQPDEISEAWVVRKPTEDGDVTSIEFYDQRHELAFQVFGERKPGKPELAQWRELVAGLEGEFA